MSPAPTLLGAVLAGGESVRFGAPKAEALVGGEPMAMRVARALAGVTGEVVLVGGRGVRGLAALQRIPDRRPARGPLGGLHAALHEASARGLEGVLIVACDLPLVSPGLLSAVVVGLGYEPAVAPTREGGVEPVCAAYRVGVLAEVERRLESGERSLHGLFRAVGGVGLDVPGAARELVNVNTPDDLRRAESGLDATLLGRGVAR